MIFRLITFALLISLQFSCKRKDTTPPIIEFLSPSIDQAFDVLTKIEIEGYAKDDQNITNIRITLTDSQNSTVGRQKHISPQEKEVSFKETIHLDDILMESGYYFLVITVTDGINENKAFRRIWINEVPKERKGVFVISSNGASTNVHLIDSLGNAGLYMNFSGDWSGTAVNSRFQELSIAGSKTGDFVVYDLSEDAKEKNRVRSFLLPEPTFTGLDHHENNSYLSYYNGMIRGYGKNGIMSTNAISLDGFFSNRIFAVKDKFISYQRTYSHPEKRLAQYFRPTGAILNNLVIDFELVGFCGKDNDNVVVFGNRNQQGFLGIYEVMRNNVWEPVSATIPVIFHAERIDEKNYILSTSAGFYQYTYPSLLAVYKSGGMCRMAKYDHINNQLIVIENGAINIYDYSTKSLLNTYSFGGNLLDVQLWYNR
jgi:hypothetical protein